MRTRGWAMFLVACALSVLGCGGGEEGGGGPGSGASGGTAGSGASSGAGGTAGAATGGAAGTVTGGSAGSGGGAAGSIAASKGIWSSADELAGKPTSGDGWTTLVSFADGDTSAPDVSNQDDPTNVRVLAAAIVYARNGDASYQSKVIVACQQVVGSEKGGRTLAWGRETGAYAMAADLVGFRTPEFEAWLHNVADVELGSELGITLRQMFYKRPNNWGAMAFGSLTAIYRYLGDDALLADVRDYWVKGVTGPNPGLSYDADVSWHADPSDLRLINPAGSSKQGVDIDGIIPDDMRRGASFTTGTPVFTGYPWEHLQGVLMAARVLQRAGLPIWNVDQDAIGRAAYALQVRLAGEFVAKGDDLWQLAFLDQAYGTSYSGSESVWGAGKNTGFAFVLP
jgi:hypothetical protein